MNDNHMSEAFWWRMKKHSRIIPKYSLPVRSRSNDDTYSHHVPLEGMNFIAKHFFEYQSFINMPHKGIQLHKTLPSEAGTDPSVGWAPKNMNETGKNQPAPSARASRVHRDPRPNGTKYGRAAKHEHREWGDRHGELKEEKVAPHKDAWTKFLSNEDPGQRTVFDCDFEDRVLAVIIPY
ncbi:hypothetical protein DICVIV_07187 [Dictyocaulus viviparus]|uniref:Uncharacterized protein n=1 Tax=Dictyocaulus viviparus TaxID=29172 RepID=A0A0D8XSM0_DICVI|nr:hypothetical protein DICVIV_07187 [Dictyocaulus viviparus]